MLRIILGVLAGAVAAMLLVGGLEAASHLVFPPPPGLDPFNPDDQATLIAMMPLGAALAVVAAWTAGAFGGALTAILIARRAWAGWIIAALIAAGGIFTVVSIPHPLWMQIAAGVAPLIGGWLAGVVAKRWKPAAAG